MRDSNKIICTYLVTYIITCAISSGLSVYGGLSELNCFELRHLYIFILNILIMIFLFRKLKVKKKNIIIYFSIMTVLLTIASIDSNIVLGPYAKYGVYSCNIIIPEDIWVISFLASYPFSGVFTPLILFNIVSKAIYVVAIVMIALTFIVSKLSEVKLQMKNK